MVKVGIAGATGYTGIELCTILSQHPDIEITHLFSLRSSGTPFSSVCPQFKNLRHLVLESLTPNALPSDMDVLFLALPHATSHAMMADIIASSPELKVVDLSADFRLDTKDAFKTFYDVDHAAPDLLDKVVYALPELYRDKIVGAQYTAVPGCYSTSSILALHPLFKAGKLSENVVIDAKSGVSGAGKGLKESSLFCEVNDSLTAYKTGAHRHQSELNQEFPGHTIIFSPHLSPQNRGILCSIYMENTAGLTQEALVQLYQDYYSDEPFVHVTSEDCPSTRSSVGSNLCVITPKVLPDSNTIVIFASIDNLVKGAAGQAVQVLNLIYGFDETTGLSQIPRHI